MKKHANWRVVTLALICAVIVGAWACQAQGRGGTPTPAPKKPAPKIAIDHTLEIDAEMDATTKTMAPTRLRVVRAERGQTIKFTTDLEIWITVPSDYVEGIDGGEDWAVGKGLIAVKISQGTHAVLRVKKDVPASDEDTEIGYSILAKMENRWFYVKGASPPRIIIPKR